MESFEEIYEQNARLVYRFLLSIIHDPNLAEELTQETFYQAVKNLNHYDHSCKISTWLCSIARNRLADYKRKNRPVISIEQLDEQLADQACFYSASSLNSTEEQVISNLNRIKILQKIHSLPNQTREVLYLRIFGCLSFREIGTIIGKSENWARVTYYRGKIKIKEVMDNEKE